MEDISVNHVGDYIIHLHLTNGEDITHRFKSKIEYDDFIKWFDSNDQRAFMFENVEKIYKKLRIRRESILFVKE